MMILWSCTFWLFWTAMATSPGSPPAFSQWFFFPQAGATRVFEVRQLSGPQADHLLLERDGASGGVIARTKVPPVFQADLRNIDGTPARELILGITVQTPVGPRRRVFVYRPEAHRIRPLWLSSRLSYVLRDFHFPADPADPRLLSREEHHGQTWHGVYAWDAFGFRPLKMTLEAEP